MKIKIHDPATIVIVVRWPRSAWSADPNDHYRPWMEEHVGEQGVDWEWGLINDDASKDNLSIRFKRDFEALAMQAKLMWA